MLDKYQQQRERESEQVESMESEQPLRREPGREQVESTPTFQEWEPRLVKEPDK